MRKHTPTTIPLKEKSHAAIETGYDAEDFGEGYWLDKNRDGHRRIDRDAKTMIAYVKALQFIEAIPTEPAPAILDVGAGPGRMVKDFRDAGYNAHGCEFSPSGRKLGKERFNIDLKFVDLRESVPWPDEQFDFAYCVGVLSMIPKAKIPVALFEICRVLKDGGLFFPMLLNPTPVMAEPHLTGMTYEEWRAHHLAAGFEEVSSLWAAQRHGLGMGNEFCGLFRKVK